MEIELYICLKIKIRLKVFVTKIPHAGGDHLMRVIYAANLGLVTHGWGPLDTNSGLVRLLTRNQCWVPCVKAAFAFYPFLAQVAYQFPYGSAILPLSIHGYFDGVEKSRSQPVSSLKSLAFASQTHVCESQPSLNKGFILLGLSSGPKGMSENSNLTDNSAVIAIIVVVLLIAIW